MDDGVIIDGQNIDLPLNLRTIADHFSDAGWSTSAYGKWSVGFVFHLPLVRIFLSSASSLFLFFSSSLLSSPPVAFKGRRHGSLGIHSNMPWLRSLPGLLFRFQRLFLPQRWRGVRLPP
jgi:hypothetical protein